MFSKENIKLDSSVHTYNIELKENYIQEVRNYPTLAIGISIVILGGINNIDFVHLKKLFRPRWSREE